MVHPVYKVHCERNVLYQWWVNEIQVWSTGGVILWRENRSTWKRTCPSSSLYTTNLMWTGLELNQGICTESLTTNCLSLFQRYCNLYWILNMCWHYKELTSVLVTFFKCGKQNMAGSWLAYTVQKNFYVVPAPFFIKQKKIVYARKH